MNLEGAISFSSNDKSIIYTVNGVDTSKYCVVIPKGDMEFIHMLVDISMEDGFKRLAGGTITKDDLVRDINNLYDEVSNAYPGCVLIMPMIERGLLDQAVISGDKQKLFDDTKMISSITSDVYKKLISGGVAKSNIDQKIVIVIKNDNDSKFVNWLEMQMSGFVSGYKLNSVSNNSLNDPFGINNNVSDNKGNDIFGSPFPKALSNGDNNVVSSTDVQTVSVEPQPVKTESIAVDNNLDDASDVSSDIKAEHRVDKKSGGFANLLILVVILVVVTVVSLELGKYLYSVYGG